MSKKNKALDEVNSSLVSHSDVVEYKTIKHDLIRVVSLNILYLAAVLVVYYTNSHTHYLEKLFSTKIHLF